MQSLSSTTEMRNSNPNPMPALLGRLAAAGLPKDYVKNDLLPDWWENSLAHDESAYAHAITLIAKFAGIKTSTLWDPSVPIERRKLGVIKCKAVQGVKAKNLDVAQGIATSVAQLIAKAILPQFVPPPSSAADIRKQMHGDGPAMPVTMAKLVNYLWKHGIPVVHVSRLPAGSRKVDGMAVRVNGRPVVIVSKTCPFSAWLGFIIAHEIGHIVLGHLADDGVLVDGTVAIGATSTDSDEIQANAFATELLTGAPDKCYRFQFDAPTPNKLADRAQKTGAIDRVDPGVVLLNYIHRYPVKQEIKWPLAARAMKIIEPNADAMTEINSQIPIHTDKSAMKPDERDFFVRMTGGKGAVSGR